MTQPRLSKLTTWSMHEKKVIEVLLEALLLLQSKKELERSEIELNRELYFCLLEANRKLQLTGRGFDFPPTPEGKNPPYYDDKERSQRENKIPDFSWGFIDNLEPDPRRSARYFVIECKRLGTPTSSDWILNINYVMHGIMRFINEEHGYAKGEAVGAMVGYIQSMEPISILEEINEANTAVNLNQVISIPITQLESVTCLQQTIIRSFPMSPFVLKHFWIDLRHRFGASSLNTTRKLKKGPRNRSKVRNR